MSSRRTNSTFSEWELEVLLAYIICGHNLNNIGYEDNTALITDTRRKLKQLQQVIIKEREKKEQNINNDRKYAHQKNATG